MKFYENQLFHIYNQGNNGRQIFFTDENYLYFIWKMRTYLLPFGDFISYSLMPNHFHWQFFVKKVEVKREIFREHSEEMEFRRRIAKYVEKAQRPNWSGQRSASKDSLISLNEAIGILQKTYTRAINKENGWSGSLMRKECKAKDGWIDEFVTLKKSNGKLDFRFQLGTDYAYQCLCYIHENAKKAGLVERDIEWRYSSARDYAELRKGSLCNLEMGRNIINFI